MKVGTMKNVKKYFHPRPEMPGYPGIDLRTYVAVEMTKAIVSRMPAFNTRKMPREAVLLACLPVRIAMADELLLKLEEQ